MKIVKIYPDGSDFTCIGRSHGAPAVPATEEDWKKMRSSQWLADMCARIEAGEEEIKGQLPVWTPRCAEFRNNHRAQKDALKPLDRMVFDIDEKGHTDDIERLMGERDGGRWIEIFKVLLLEESVRHGTHVCVRLPVGMSPEKAQERFSKVVGMKVDPAVKNVAGCIYMVPEGYTRYTDEAFYKSPLPPEGETLDSKINAEDSQRESVTTPLPLLEGQGGGSELSYMGIDYAKIVAKYWELFYGGHTPIVSNRDVLTYEIAVNLRHICGFDEELMDKVIPCYDGFPQEQKMKCIRSAIEAKRTQMPRKLREVLEALSCSYGDNMKVIDAIDKIKDEDDAMYARQLTDMPMGISDSMEPNGEGFALPSLLVAASCVGVRATNVKMKVHHKACGLNIYPFVCGEFASGKGYMDQIFKEWTKDLQKDADEYYDKEQEWAQKAMTKKSGTTEKAPQYPVRMLPLNNTLANIAERLGNTKGRHAISFTPEADMVFSKWKGCMTDFSVMLRIAYDEERFDREAKSAEAVRVHIPHLLWNVIMCGTQDSLYRLVDNVTDGFLSRLCICKTPDNTWERYQERNTNFTQQQCHNIEAMTNMLSLAEGVIEDEELEEIGKEWLEEIRITAIKSYDKVLARQRFRGCVNAQRVAGAVLLCKCLEYLYEDCERMLDKAVSKLHRNPQCWMVYIDRCFENGYMERVFRVVADALLDVTLFFFRDKLTEAYSDKTYAKATTGRVASRKSENNSVFDRLPSDFSYEQAMSLAVDVKGPHVTANTVHQMLKNWKNQGLIVYNGDKTYSKIKA